MLLSFELTVEKVSVEVYTYMPPAKPPDEALFALMRPLYGTTPSGPLHWKDSGLSVKDGRAKAQLHSSKAPTMADLGITPGNMLLTKGEKEAVSRQLVPSPTPHL